MFRDNSECYDWGSSAESEWEGDDSMHPLSVTGRNPAASESNVVDYHDVSYCGVTHLSLRDEHWFQSSEIEGCHGQMAKRKSVV